MVWAAKETELRNNKYVKGDWMKIVIVCVNYNSYDSLIRYLDSINEAIVSAFGRLELTVLIGDNSSEIRTIVRKYDFDIKHFPTNNNLGYFGGIEYAIKESGTNLSEYDYIIISNVDLTVDKNFFSELLDFHVDDSIGCIAPSIYSISDKRDRNPKIISRPSKNKLILQKTLYKYPILDRIYVGLFYAKRREKVQQYPEGYIYAAHGSFIVFTNKFATFLQHMKYPCFLFGEEIYLAEHLAKNSLKTYYQPKLRVYDDDHVSTSKMRSKSYYHYNYLSIEMILKEFYA